MIYTIQSSPTDASFVIETMMNNLKREPAFFMAVIAAIYLYVFAPSMEDIQYQLVVAGILFVIILLCIFRVAHFADVLAEMLGEPYGTLLLTICATLIEVAVMVTALTHGASITHDIRKHSINTCIPLESRLVLKADLGFFAKT